MFLINIPHYSTYIPKEYIKDYIIKEEELEELVKRFSDIYTNLLYEGLYKNNIVLKSDYSRLFLDVERFFDDNKEVQYKYGMGWYYTKSPFENKVIRNEESKSIVSKIYKDYHNKFDELVTNILKENNKCSIMDCHSFSSETLYFQNKDIDKPDICIGYDDYHKDNKVIDIILKEFEDYKIKFNSPYSGSIVPIKYYGKDDRVKSTMIEINKQLYVDESTFKIKEKEFQKISNHLKNINKQLL